MIVENRLVKDKTFATRFYSFVKDMRGNCACSEEEVESMQSYAKELLKLQCTTATDKDEILYLKRVGVYDEFSKPILTTYDKIKVYDPNKIIFTCLKNPDVNDDLISVLASKPLKPNSDYFSDRSHAYVYLELNKIQFSKKDMIAWAEKQKNV